MKTEKANTIGFCPLILIAGALWTLVASDFVSMAQEGKPQILSSPVGRNERAKSNPTNLSNGIEIKRGEMLLSVVALRDDVLRVRFANNGVLPEDASWAVALEIRRSHVDV